MAIQHSSSIDRKDYYMTSINDVAKRANVSTSTVSKVLNNYKNISSKTREKVLEAVDELNYVPNAIASALSSKNEKRIAVLVFINLERQAIDEINMQYLFGTFERAQEYGIEVVTIFSNVLDKMSKMEIVLYFNSLRIQTILVYGLHKEEQRFSEIIEEKHFKMVLVDVPIYSEKISYVMVDHQSGQYDIAKEMVEMNPTPVKKILYLAGRRDGYVTDLRLQGIVDLCEDKGIKLDAHYADFSEKKAISLVHQHARENDIVVCASDLMAIGAVSALDEMNIFKPVCGYDGIKLLGYVDYKMMTVHQNFYRIAQVAVDEVKNLIDGKEGRSIILDYRIGTVSYEEVIL